MDASRKYRPRLDGNGNPIIGGLHIAGFSWDAASSDNHIDRLFEINGVKAFECFELVHGDNEMREALADDKTPPPARKPKKQVIDDTDTEQLSFG
jgi:hypothetical protein